MPRLVPGWPRLLLLLVPPLLGAGILAAALAMAPPQPSGAIPIAGPQPALPPVPGLLVHVNGAVVHPGLYRLHRGDRVYAALGAAGGLAPGADSDRMPDLAGRLRDGQQVRVPFLKGSGGRLTAGRVPVNTATAEELASVPGFTPDLAQAVVAYRDQYGPLAALGELTSVLGMSRADYALARKVLVLG